MVFSSVVEKASNHGVQDSITKPQIPLEVAVSESTRNLTINYTLIQYALIEDTVTHLLLDKSPVPQNSRDTISLAQTCNVRLTHIEEMHIISSKKMVRSDY